LDPSKQDDVAMKIAYYRFISSTLLQ